MLGCVQWIVYAWLCTVIPLDSVCLAVCSDSNWIVYAWLCAVIPLGSVHVCLLGSDCKNVLPRVDSYFHLCLSHMTGWVVYVLMEFCLPGNQSHPPRQARGGGGSAARGAGQGKEHVPYSLTSAYHGGGWVLCNCCQRVGAV